MARLTPAQRNHRIASRLRGEVNGLCVHALEPEAGIPFTEVLGRTNRPPPESQENVPLEADCDCLLPTNGRPKRNLVICIDGTSNKFSATSSNVVGIFSHLIKDENQLAYYNSGIGAMAVTSPGILSYLWRAFTNAIDMAFARHVDTIIMDAYRWLAENYEDGDVVYMFGFSRGAYQVRALAGMIERVGLVHKGNIGQIPFAYEMYLEQRSWEFGNRIIFYPTQTIEVMAALKSWFKWCLASVVAYPVTTFGVWMFGGDLVAFSSFYYFLWKWAAVLMVVVAFMQFRHQVESHKDPLRITSSGDRPGEAKYVNQLAARFKKLCARNIKIHFVGCWDTVSSIGTVRQRTLPLANSTGHICFFRHALALHERRVRFLPEFVQYSKAQGSADDSESIHSALRNFQFRRSESDSPEAARLETVKEVWFAGTHSDVGGTVPLEIGGSTRIIPSLRWMGQESMTLGLRFRTPEDQGNQKRKTLEFGTNPKPTFKCFRCPGAITYVAPFMSPIWQLLEYLPLNRPNYSGPAFLGMHPPHKGAPRAIQPGQRLHYSAKLWLEGQCRNSMNFPSTQGSEGIRRARIPAAPIPEEYKLEGSPTTEFDPLDIMTSEENYWKEKGFWSEVNVFVDPDEVPRTFGWLRIAFVLGLSAGSCAWYFGD